ncbi:hypothetical protein GF312_10755 [Candidatus Poribacteria bacterium]|nr:hypothetical protein [Candidatus Poribacteria bacterium]
MKHRKIFSVMGSVLVVFIILVYSIAVYLENRLPIAPERSIIPSGRLLSWYDKDPLLADIEAPKNLYVALSNNKFSSLSKVCDIRTGLLAQMLSEEHTSLYPFHMFVTATVSLTQYFITRQLENVYFLQRYKNEDGDY